MTLYLLTIQDKTLYGEPDVSIAVVDAPDEETALRAARPTIVELAERGRCRCVPHARLLEPGKFYRLGAVVRLPLDPNAEAARRSAAAAVRRGALMGKNELPDLPCPRCKSPDTVPLRNYGRPVAGEAPGTMAWWCLQCRHRFDGPEVPR